MKAVIVLSFSILFLLSNIFSQPTGLIEAKGLGLIDFSIHGNTSSTHYYRPLDLHMINRSGECLQITVGRGLIMEADEEAYQNFITTREEQIVMEAYEQKSVQLFAMCIEKSDMSPVSSTTFNPTQMADSALTGLVTMIEKDSLYTYESQAAIWALACNTPLTEIVGFDTVLTRNLVEYVAAATG
nr:hypothetical protein [Bacteroidota bacterium]